MVDLVTVCADAIAEKRGVAADDRVDGMMSVFRMDARAVLIAERAMAGAALDRVIELARSYVVEYGAADGDEAALTTVADLARPFDGLPIKWHCGMVGTADGLRDLTRDELDKING